MILKIVKWLAIVIGVLLLVAIIAGIIAGGFAYSNYKKHHAADFTKDGSYMPGASQANLAESETIKQKLTALPGVVRVDGGYSRDLENPGSVSFSMGVDANADLAAIADKAVELVWQSRLDPVSSMSVFVARYPDNPDDNIRRFADFKFDKDALAAKYGPPGINASQQKP